MAEQNVTPLPTKMGFMESIVEGKVTEIEQPSESEWTYYTVSLKSKDEYSSPRTIQISQPASQRPFCRTDDVVKVKVEIGGYARRYNGNRYITNTLTFVELI